MALNNPINPINVTGSQLQNPIPVYSELNNQYSGYSAPTLPANNYYIQQPQQSPNMVNTPNNTPQIMSDRVWAQGENAAKAYLVSRNTEQTIWDSEQPVIYIKTVDAYGRPSMITLDYTIRQETSPNQNVASSNDVNDLRNEFNDLRNELKQFMQQSAQEKRYKQQYNKKGGNQND